MSRISNSPVYVLEAEAVKLTLMNKTRPAARESPQVLF